MAWYRCGMNGTYNATTVSRSGAVCNYVANVGGVSLSRFIANITPVQASGTPTPINPLPITGWSAVNVNDYQGKNLFNKDGTQTTPFFFGQGNSTFNQNSSAITVTVYAPCKPNTTYTISKTAGKRFIVGYGDTIPIKGYPVRNAVTNLTASSMTITTDSTAKFLYAFIWNSNYDTISSADMIASTQIEENSEATAYEPYTGQTATINLGQTVYGGTLNVGTGVLTVTHVNIASYNGETINEPWLCSEAPYIPNTTPPTGSQVVYPLTTPQTVQLTPVQITQLLGENNVWADSGDSEVDFFKIIRT